MLITLEKKYRKKYYQLLNQVFDSGFWSEGNMVKTFEENFSEFIKTPSIAVTSGGTALHSIFTYLSIKDKEVIVPANTFIATILAIKNAGGIPVFADCSKKDLCLNLDSIKAKLTKKTKAVCLVHIGGHIAFDVEKIVKFCKKNNITLVEDCAHAHGATYKNKAAGSFGFAGAYSFYATKTMPLGEGGIVCSKDKKFLKWLKAYRNYGKQKTISSYKYVSKNGSNLRMNEVTAALGIIQLERLPAILEWKSKLAKKYDKIFTNRVILPEDMISGYYKYIVFNYKLNHKTGKVYSSKDMSSFITNNELIKLPNTYWLSKNHVCIPTNYKWIPLTTTNYQLKKKLLRSFES